MSTLTATDARCALFASRLQQSDEISPDVVARAINAAIGRHSVQGCASLVAEEFGDHPETAALRMRWARRLTDEMLADARYSAAA